MRKIILLVFLLSSCGYEVDLTPNFILQDKTATLSWIAPTENTDNTPLTDLAGFKIYYGLSGQYSVIDINNPSISEYVIDNIDPPGIYYFYVTAYNSLGIESAPSETVSKEIK